ncbi:MAG: hypothetical protein C0502_05045 [Opitutus sp.]|nr:hypothetical protein [Opitutus sp.]
MGPAAAALAALAGGPDAALQPDVNTLDAKQSSSIQFGAAFQVGGRGSQLDSRPSLTGAPADSSRVANGTGGLSGMDGNTLFVIGAVVVGLLLFVFTAGRRHS